MTESKHERPAADVAVIGTGIVGLAVTWELLHRGATVVLVGPRSKGPADASRAAGAMLSLFSEVEPSQDSGRIAVDVSERLVSRRLWATWFSRLAEEAGVTIENVRGTWVVARADEYAALDAIATTTRQHGHIAEQHRINDMPSMPASRHVAAALWLPSEGSVDSADLLAALSQVIANHPCATWHDEFAIEVRSKQDSAIVCCASYSIIAGWAVVAAGAKTATLFRDQGRRLRIPAIITGHGSSLLLRTQDRPAHAVRTPNRAFGCGVHVVPRSNGLTYVGGTNRFVDRPEISRLATLDEVAVLIDSVTADIDGRLFDAELLAVQAGQRPYTLDRLPLVGPTVDPQILLATATYRSGIMLAPRIANLVADEITAPGSHRKHPYRLDRPMVLVGADTVLGAECLQLIDALCEPGGKLPPGVAERLSSFIELALRVVLISGGTEARTSAIRELWARAPISEALPAIIQMAQSTRSSRDRYSALHQPRSVDVRGSRGSRHHSGMATHNIDVVVVGAGVIGLTTAVSLVEAGVTVKIVSAAMPEETTSASAGAIWGPYLVEPHEKVRPWGQYTLDVLESLCTERGAGVRLSSGIEASRFQAEPPSWAEQISDFEPCASNELPLGFVVGWRLTAPVVNMPVYLNYLLERFVAAGGRIEKGHLTSLKDGAPEGRIVVNCTGISARHLVPDDTLQPVRGQAIVVTNPGISDFFVEDRGADRDQLYIFPHEDTVVLGGTLEPGEWDLTPDSRTSERILQDCQEIVPMLAGARVVAYRVGLRPSRPEIRLEACQLSGGRLLFHNYGHGGAGVSLSWGCAAEVTEEVLRAL
jgi:glycine/D-amino acid oxidase-like deaminating enzyme